MLTKLQLEIIDKYVKEDFYDKEKLTRYLNMHEMVGNEIFDYVDRKNRNLYRKEAHSNILDGEIGYEPVNTETFVRRILFYFYTSLIIQLIFMSIIFESVKFIFNLSINIFIFSV